MLDLTQYRIGMTGGNGFLGRHLCQRLRELGCEHIYIPSRQEYDLTEQSHVRQWYKDTRPDIVFHLAAEVGGIGANRQHPGRFFYANAAMGIHLIEEARRYDVQKFIQVGTICAYPKFTPVPFKEDDLWKGYPEETNAPYGIAKKALHTMLQAYRSEYGFNGIYLLPVNLYGPGDNFDLQSSHVIPALIRKCLIAKQNRDENIVCWGTGKASREFLYVEDCAEALILAAQHYDGDQAINLGTGQEITIYNLVHLIAKLCEYNGKIEWDTDKPDGQPRRCLDINRAKTHLGFDPKTDFETGLRRTIEWYANQLNAIT